MKMEQELKQWNDEISKSRNNFHVLNLFTTQQLRVIRQQLGQLSCETIPSLPPVVLSMLMSISPKVCERDIMESLQSVKSKNSLVGQPLSKKAEDLEDFSSPVDHDGNVQMQQFNPDDEVSIEAAIEKLLNHLIDQLSGVEKEAYDDLKKSDYADNVAYLSVKNCVKSTIQQGDLIIAASAWCLENENRYKNKDPKLMLKELQAFNTQNDEPILNEQNTQNENVTSSVAQSQNDKVYLMELTLIENDIPSGLAREAAKRYPDDIAEALSYCLNEQSRSTDQSFLQLPSTDGGR